MDMVAKKSGGWINSALNKTLNWLEDNVSKLFEGSTEGESFFSEVGELAMLMAPSPSSLESERPYSKISDTCYAQDAQRMLSYCRGGEHEPETVAAG
jgi:hypothetical protein